MNDSYDIPSEPRLSNTFQRSRPPPPKARAKMKQKKRFFANNDTTTIFLGLDDTVPLDGK